MVYNKLQRTNIPIIHSSGNFISIFGGLKKKQDYMYLSSKECDETQECELINGSS